MNGLRLPTNEILIIVAMCTSLHFIVNPAAAGGRVIGWWQKALPILRTAFSQLEFTVASPSVSLANLVDRVARFPEENINLVGVGGDGTHHDIVNALVRQGLTNRVTYCPLPFGSGNDWCRTLKVPRDLNKWIELVRKGKTIKHRIGGINYRDTDGRERQQFFVNVAGLAYDAEVVRRAAGVKFKHRLIYPLLTTAYLPGFRPPRLQLTYDGQTVEGNFHTINIGIGKYNGGGMRLVPQADPTADTFALTYGVGLPLGRILINGWRFFTGSIGAVKGVTTTHARHIVVEGATGVEADGEWLGDTPVSVTLIDERLRVFCLGASA